MNPNDPVADQAKIASAASTAALAGVASAASTAATFTEMSDLELSALYGRASTDRQDGSLETQVSTARQYAAKNGLRIPDELIFLDEDASGSLPLLDREMGKLMMKTLELHAWAGPAGTPRIRHLIVAKLDRLGRSLVDLQLRIQELEKAGITVHFCNLPLPMDNTPMGKLMRKLFLQMLSMFAEFERDMIVQRIQDRMAQKRTNGELCGTVPYGKVAVGTGRLNSKTEKEIMRLEPCPEEEHWLLQMDSWRRSGYSYKRIAHELNRLGVLTKIPKGTPICIGRDPVTKERIIQPHSGKWRTGNVAGVLQNPYTQQFLATHREPAVPPAQQKPA